MLSLYQAYQHSASFVPKLATKIMQWLDPQKDDVILDIGCGGKQYSLISSRRDGRTRTNSTKDGVLDIDIAKTLSQGKGSLHGIDSSPAMIQAADQAAAKDGLKNCTFEGKAAFPSFARVSFAGSTNHQLLPAPQSSTQPSSSISQSSSSRSSPRPSPTRRCTGS